MDWHATALLADVRLPPDYWSYACRWVAYVHTHRVTEILINEALPHFGDVVVVHQAFKKPPSFENRGVTGVCLGHDNRIADGVLVVSVINGELKEVCSAKVRVSGEKVGQAWRQWNLQEIEVPTVEQCVREDALEVQDIRELGLGWACIVNDLRTFLPAWQDMELASPSPEEPATQIEADVPVEPLALQADATNLDLELHAYERPLAVTPGGTPEVVPNWQDTHVMHTTTCASHLGKWIRTDLGARTLQGLGENSPAREQVVRRITRDLCTQCILEDLICDSLNQVPLHRRCLPECSPSTSHTRDIVTTFEYRLQTLMSMRQFLEDAERENEKETGTCDAELKVMASTADTTDLATEKMDVSDPEINDSHSSVHKGDAQKEAIMALRMLFEDFADQVQYQDEIQEESASETEISPERSQAADPSIHLSHILPL